MNPLLFALAVAAASTPEGLLAKVQHNYNAFIDFSAEFRQTMLRASRPGKGRVETGNVFIKRPAMMRWDYADPEVKNFIIDGERLWFYKPDEAQVTVHEHFKEGELSAGISFLFGKAELAKSFNVSHFAGPDPQGGTVAGEAIKLVPKKDDPAIKDIVFYLDDKGFISKAFMTDHIGNTNVLEFRKIALDQGLKREAFLFVPPEGVKVVHVD